MSSQIRKVFLGLLGSWWFLVKNVKGLPYIVPPKLPPWPFVARFQPGGSFLAVLIIKNPKISIDSLEKAIVFYFLLGFLMGFIIGFTVCLISSKCKPWGSWIVCLPFKNLFLVFTKDHFGLTSVSLRSHLGSLRFSSIKYPRIKKIKKWSFFSWQYILVS